MGNATRWFVFSPLAFACAVSVTMQAFAQESLQNSLNILLQAADDSTGLKPTAEVCQLLDKLAHSGDSRDSARFKDLSKKLFLKRCSAVKEDSQSQMDSEPTVSDSVWDGEPMCDANSTRVLKCQHNAKTGRGLFVYSGSGSPESAPTLVCAHLEATHQSPIDSAQEVDSRCVLTEFDWRYEAQRSDVHGIQTWLQSPVGRSALVIPAALKDQCKEVFSDALYCAPSLIVLPEQDVTRVTICGLKTRQRVFGFSPVLNISSSNSQWTCESKSLLEADRDQRLSVEERSCVPDHLGRLNNQYCRLPYLPVARRPVRTYLP